MFDRVDDKGLGVAAHLADDLDTARREITASIIQHASLENERGTALQRRHLADVHPETALPHYEHTAAVFTQPGGDYQLALALCGHARALLALGGPDQTRETALRALDAATRTGSEPVQTSTRLALADIARADSGTTPGAPDTHDA